MKACKKMNMILAAALALALFAGCAPAASPAPSSAQSAASSAPVESSASSAPAQAQPALADGVYTVQFETDSSMFRANEACDGKGTLTVEDGQMTLHVSLASQKIQNLFVGTAQQAQQEGAALLQPTLDTVTYTDGTTEQVHGFDVPVAVVGQDFDLALVGTKGTWYDHKVSVQNPVLQNAAPLPEDGSYTCDVTMGGGSGRAGIQSPAQLRVENGVCYAQIVWSSSSYDYMLVDGQRYEVKNTGGNSAFEIPVAAFDQTLTVVANTVAMSTPHEITYTLCFDSASLRAAK